MNENQLIIQKKCHSNIILLDDAISYFIPSDVARRKYTDEFPVEIIQTVRFMLIKIQ